MAIQKLWKGLKMGNSKVDLSIIVPCFNVEKYVARCIDSLINQTLDNTRYEIILVDDASTDCTWKIITEYEKKYPDMIIAVHCDENGRQGKARNVGLEYASGEYIGYIDSDDWIDSDMYEIMLSEIMNYSGDIVHCNYIRDDGTRKIDCNSSGNIQRLLVDTQSKRGEFIVSGCIGYGCVTDVIKKSILVENNIQFPEKIAYEDLFWRSIVYLYVKKISLIDKKFYHYYINPQSTVLKKNDDYHLDLMKINELKYNEYIRRGFLKLYRDELEFDMLDTWYLGMIKTLAFRFDKPPYSEFIKLKSIFNKLMPEAALNKYIEGQFNEMQKLLISLLNVDVSETDFYNVINICRKTGV